VYSGEAVTTQEPQQPLSSAADDSAVSQSGAAYFAEAADAFRAGNYSDALRLANHAAIESPQNPKAAELMSLASFARGDDRAASGEAHAALALGPPADWNTVYAYYGNVDTYTTQLRDLEKYCKDNPAAADAHFVLAYQYLLTGHTNKAVQQLDDVVKLSPQDKLAADLLKKYGGKPSLPVPPAPAADSASTGV
jgi:tetratricopeptide (TPR) repeat protein